MTHLKINLLLLPLLVSILLSTGSKLKIGKDVDNVFYRVLSPVHTPIGFLRKIAESQISLIKSFPSLRQQNKDLISEKTKLLSENERLKQSITDTKTLNSGISFKSVLPVRLTGSIGNNSVASSMPISNVKVGQPLVSGNTLVGLVSDIKGSIINISPLDNERLQTITVHTTSGQKGQYKYQNNMSIITDVPSLSPIVIDDYVFSEPSEQIPGNLVIGKIIKIISAQQEPLQKAQIQPEITLRDNPDDLVIILNP